MHFLITPRRRLGVALSTKEVQKAQPIKGDVQINEMHNESLGRTTVEASVMNYGPPPPRLPSLVDARVTGMGTLGLNITGVEEIEGTFYFQSWWCRFE